MYSKPNLLANLSNSISTDLTFSIYKENNCFLLIPIDGKDADWKVLRISYCLSISFSNNILFNSS